MLIRNGRNQLGVGLPNHQTRLHIHWYTFTALLVFCWKEIKMKLLFLKVHVVVHFEPDFDLS